jgi:hypothetical protein
MLFKEIIPIYTENDTKPINENADILTVNAAGTYSYHSAFNLYRTGI